MQNIIDSKKPWELKEKEEINKLRELLKNKPKDPSLHYELGSILIRRWGSKEREWGIKHLQEAVKLKKDFPEVFELLALEAQSYDINKAIRLYKKAADLYKSQGNKEKADEILNQAAMQVVYDGWEFLNDRDSITAKKKAQRVLSIYPHCIDAKNILASIHMDRFEFVEAERTYHDAIRDALVQQGGKTKKDYLTNHNLKAAYDFCNIYGPLWLRQKSSYIFLLEGTDAAS